MDTLTHIVLGGCIGEAIGGKQFGKKAILAGALSQSSPDIDFLAYFWLGKTENLLAHRGITHSFLFAAMATWLFSWCAIKLFRNKEGTAKTWILLLGTNLIVHILLDSLNAYGVGWWEPFSKTRISFHLLYVADPFFTLFPFIAFILVFLFKRPHLRRLASVTGLVIASGYIGYAFYNKSAVESKLVKDLSAQGISYEKFFSTPTPLNSWLWFAVVKGKAGYYTTARSVFDKQATTFTYWPRNDSLLRQVKNQDEAANLVRFSNDYYTVERTNDTLLLNVLRFGQSGGWYDPRAPFAFHYYLDKPGANELLVQRGRFQNWNRGTLRSFIRRIRGL